MFSTKVTFHRISLDTSVKRPKKFTYPFSYVPHPWVWQVAEEVQQYLENQTDFEYAFGWDDDSVGKMFGVLIVEDLEGQLGYLAAFSGKINEQNNLAGFVPPVFDVLDPTGFFKIGEKELNAINQEIQALENADALKRLQSELETERAKLRTQLKELKTKQKTAKLVRQRRRKDAQDLEEDSKAELLLLLENESKRDHFELKDFKRKGKERLRSLEERLYSLLKPIESLKVHRKKLSSELQQKVHKSFKFLNGKGEERHLLELFKPFEKMPPAGAGECAAPRLLQYAFAHGLEPVAMGEFWWGKPSTTVVRKPKKFYPACKSKCKPILTFMLEGLDVEENPIPNQIQDFKLDIIYEDEYLLLVNKPTAVLSVPGKEIDLSLQTKLKKRYPENNMTLAHRLDMATSGLVLIAKSDEVYKNLQSQFTHRTVKKTYTAILDGVPQSKAGKIDLPLRVDLDHRPMQMVCKEYGKEATTYYKVINIEDGKARVLFYPYTGRTHQLRVHAAHPDGLNIPIRGDVLYGKPQKRLYLHATELTFYHPYFNKELKFSCSVPF
ncbi:RNA pseudouridine synthase [Flavobacteriaceae bacterium Ap0902]|nr:RNA pseudouridine synthase [Flavobacteriaceae bacterium Ap0902]